MKAVEQITDKPVVLESEFSLSNLKGKKVISHSGDVVGKVKDIIIYNYGITGILISKYMRPDLYVDRKFFDSFRQDAVVLKIDPITSIVGLDVLDCNGRRVGKVSRIERADMTNVLVSFHVKRRIHQKDITLKASDIQAISQHVILNIELE